MMNNISRENVNFHAANIFSQKVHQAFGNTPCVFLGLLIPVRPCILKLKVDIVCVYLFWPVRVFLIDNIILMTCKACGACYSMFIK